MNNSNQVWGKPVLYKGLNVYPVRMIDIFDFYDYVQCLLLSKNTSQDIEIIKMSYLSYLMYVTNTQENLFIRKFIFELFKMVFRVDEVLMSRTDKGRYVIHINGVDLYEKDFDKIKKIIAEQNLIDVEEEIVDSELEKKMKEAREFLSKRNGKMADVEQQITAYHCATGLTYDYIGQLTIYQFRKGLSRLDLIKSADIIQSARYSGMVTFKDETNIPTWLSYIEEPEKDSDVLMSKGEFDTIAADNGLISK